MVFFLRNPDSSQFLENERMVICRDVDSTRAQRRHLTDATNRTWGRPYGRFLLEMRAVHIDTADTRVYTV